MQQHQESKTANIANLRRELLASRIGDFSGMTPEDLLEMAGAAEQTMRDVGPFDPAYAYFVQQRDDYLKAAVMNEEASHGASAL